MNRVTLFFKVSMSSLLLLALAPVFAGQAHATTLKAFEDKPAAQQAQIISDFVETMTNDIAQRNPELAQQIRDYFTKADQGNVSEGVRRLAVEIEAVDSLAKEGKADPSKIQVEGMIVTIVKERFQK